MAISPAGPSPLQGPALTGAGVVSPPASGGSSSTSPFGVSGGGGTQGGRPAAVHRARQESRRGEVAAAGETGKGAARGQAWPACWGG
uniref:Uncharacterized protein n=1 Tax=Oryza sativa subsp. japonica TaxID=39947 RepID=Q6Z2A7_ORYSJ|nr:hypothetical protein [Oryza sativa Japonica Group]BAD01382.1 hypothetical protein [Oryza sativa Japonica Group]